MVLNSFQDGTGIVCVCVRVCACKTEKKIAVQMPTHLESICEDHWFSPQLGPFIYFSLSEHLGFSLRHHQVWMESQSRGWDEGLLARGGSERGEQRLLNYSADFSSNAIARGLRNPSQAGKALKKKAGMGWGEDNQRRFSQIKAIMRSEKCPLSPFTLFPLHPIVLKMSRYLPFLGKKKKEEKKKLDLDHKGNAMRK